MVLDESMGASILGRSSQAPATIRKNAVIQYPNTIKSAGSDFANAIVLLKVASKDPLCPGRGLLRMELCRMVG